MLKLQTNLIHKGTTLKRVMSIVDGNKVVEWYQKDTKSEIVGVYLPLGDKESADMELVYMDEYGMDMPTR